MYIVLAIAAGLFILSRFLPSYEEEEINKLKKRVEELEDE